MAQENSTPEAGSPVFSENRARSASARAGKVLQGLQALKGTLQGVSDDLAKTSGHTFSKGYLSLVIHGKRPASKDLLIALGLKAARKPEGPGARQARRERQALNSAYADLHSAVMAGYAIGILKGPGPDGWWQIEIMHAATLAKASFTSTSFTEAVSKAVNATPQTNSETQYHVQETTDHTTTTG